MNVALQALASIPGLVDTILTETQDLELDDPLKEEVMGHIRNIFGEYKMKCRLEALDDRRISYDLSHPLWTSMKRLFYPDEDPNEWLGAIDLVIDFLNFFGKQIPFPHPRKFLDYFEHSSVELKNDAYEAVRSTDVNLIAYSSGFPNITSKIHFEGKWNEIKYLCGPPVLVVLWIQGYNMSSTLSDSFDLTNVVNDTNRRHSNITEKTQEDASYMSQAFPPQCNRSGQSLKYSLAFIGLWKNRNHYVCCRKTFVPEPQWYLIDDLPRSNHLTLLPNDRKEWPLWIRNCPSLVSIYLRDDYFGIKNVIDVTEEDIVPEEKYERKAESTGAGSIDRIIDKKQSHSRGKAKVDRNFASWLLFVLLFLGSCVTLLLVLLFILKKRNPHSQPSLSE